MSITIASARKNLGTVVDKAEHRKARIVITRHGRAAAAVVPIEDVKFLRRLEDAIDLDAAKKALREERVSWASLKKELRG